MFVPMLVGTTTLLVAGLALAAVGTGVSFVAGRKQAKAGRKAAKETQKLAALGARRARRKTIREARIKRGAALNVAGQVGAGQSSGLRGGLSGLASQAGANLGFSSQTEGIGRNITKFGLQASKAQELGAIGAGITGLGGALFSNAGALNALGASGGGGVPNFGNRGGGGGGGR